MPDYNSVEIISDFDIILKTQVDAIREVIPKDRPLRILEAGCGREWYLNLGAVKYDITGIDLDKEALEFRKNVKKDLTEAIVGDLNTIDLAGRKFDLVYCSFVLEHLPDAEGMMDRLLSWVAPNGMLIVKIPDPHSVDGFFTRTTPHWFHVFYYRWFVGYKDAGKPGHGPYRTFYGDVVSVGGMRAVSKKNGVSLFGEFKLGDTSKKTPLRRLITTSIRRVFSVLSLGKLSGSHINLMYMFRVSS